MLWSTLPHVHFTRVEAASQGIGAVEIVQKQYREVHTRVNGMLSTLAVAAGFGYGFNSDAAAFVEMAPGECTVLGPDNISSGRLEPQGRQIVSCTFIALKTEYTSPASVGSRTYWGIERMHAVHLVGSMYRTLGLQAMVITAT